MTVGDLAENYKEYSRTSCATLIFTVSISLNNFVALLFVDIVIQQPQIVYLYHSNVGKSHLGPIFRGVRVFPCSPALVRAATP